MWERITRQQNIEQREDRPLRAGVNFINQNEDFKTKIKAQENGKITFNTFKVFPYIIYIGEGVMVFHSCVPN